MDDDELERLLRAANPARTPIDAEPDFALMERIMSGPDSTRTSRASHPASSRGRRLAVLMAPAAALIVAVVALVVTNPFGQSPAIAYGPPPLEWTATDQSVTEVPAMTIDRLADSAGPDAAQRESTVTSWSVSINEAGEADEVTTISPLVTELSWQEDLSGRRQVAAGTPYSVTGSTVPSDALEPGTVIDDMQFGPGEYPVVVPDAGSLDEAGFQQLLSMYAPAETGSLAGDAMIGIADVLGEWTLTNAQHGYLVEALIGYDGLSVLGTTADRLGRPVIGLQAPSTLRPGETTTLLISSATGRIVGMENIVTGPEASTPVPAGTVIHYALWKDTE